MLAGLLRVLALAALLTCGARRVLGGGLTSNVVLIVTDDQDQILGGMVSVRAHVTFALTHFPCSLFGIACLVCTFPSEISLGSLFLDSWSLLLL